MERVQVFRWVSRLVSQQAQTWEIHEEVGVWDLQATSTSIVTLIRTWNASEQNASLEPTTSPNQVWQAVPRASRLKTR